MIDKHNDRNCSSLSLVVLCKVPDGACMSLRGTSTDSIIDVTVLAVKHESKVKTKEYIGCACVTYMCMAMDNARVCVPACVQY